MSKRLVLAVLLAVSVPAPAFADKAAADACAASLPSEAKLIYDRAMPGVAAGGNLQAVVKDSAVALVKGGQVSRTSARGAATEAGKCLMQL